MNILFTQKIIESSLSVVSNHHPDRVAVAELEQYGCHQRMLNSLEAGGMIWIDEIPLKIRTAGLGQWGVGAEQSLFIALDRMASGSDPISKDSLESITFVVTSVDMNKLKSLCKKREAFSMQDLMLTLIREAI